MKLTFDPGQTLNPEKEAAIPPGYTRYIVHWASPAFYQIDFGKILLQELISNEFGIYLWKLNIERGTRLFQKTEVPVIAIQFILDGKISNISEALGRKIFKKGNYVMYYRPAGSNEIWLEAGDYELLIIELQPAYFAELIAIRSDFGELVSAIKISADYILPLPVAQLNYITGSILLNLKNCDKTGPILQLEMHKYILELLSEYFAGISRDHADKSAQNQHHREMMTDIRNHILLEPNLHHHTLKKLARQFGISESLLKRAFKNNFNMSLSEFVRYHVMTKSYHLITTTTMSIEEIAEEGGYAWRPAFETAFKKQYNYSPSQIRHDLNS